MENRGKILGRISDATSFFLLPNPLYTKVFQVRENKVARPVIPTEINGNRLIQAVFSLVAVLYSDEIRTQFPTKFSIHLHP